MIFVPVFIASGGYYLFYFTSFVEAQLLAVILLLGFPVHPKVEQDF